MRSTDPKHYRNPEFILPLAISMLSSWVAACTERLGEAEEYVVRQKTNEFRTQIARVI